MAMERRGPKKNLHLEQANVAPRFEMSKGCGEEAASLSTWWGSCFPLMSMACENTIDLAWSICGERLFFSLAEANKKATKKKGPRGSSRLNPKP